MTENKGNQNIHDLVPSYALGLLGESDRTEFERHLASGCPPCQAELGLDNETTVRLAEAVETAPPDGLRERLLARVRQSPQSPGLLLNQQGILISRSSEMDWKQLAPGVSHKPLFRDKSRHYRTSLVRMDPGAQLAKHRHPEAEEVFLISGDFQFAGMTMGAGDYCRAEANSVHEVASTINGCLFLLSASDRNEVIA